MDYLFELIILPPLLLFIFWELFIARILGVSVWTILGIKFGANWALKNFTPKVSKQPAKVKRDPNPKNNQDMFYEDA